MWVVARDRARCTGVSPLRASPPSRSPKTVSRYVEISLPASTLDEVAASLTTLGLVFERPRRRVLLQGSLECEGEPVDLRLAAGVLDTVEDFGFVRDQDGSMRLVCGELDQRVLEASLVPALQQTRSEAAVHQAATAAGMRIARTDLEPDGTRRLVLEVDDDAT